MGGIASANYDDVSDWEGAKHMINQTVEEFLRAQNAAWQPPHEHAFLPDETYNEATDEWTKRCACGFEAAALDPESTVMWPGPATCPSRSGRIEMTMPLSCPWFSPSMYCPIVYLPMFPVRMVW